MEHKPQLFIEIQSDSSIKNIEESHITETIYNEMDKYSITPKTLKSRTFPDSVEAPYFQESYVHETSSVVRFGLNIHAPSLIESIERHNNTAKKVDVQSQLSSVVSKKGEQKVLIIKQWCNDSKSILTDLEGTNTNQAIEYLKKGKTCALIDIFERDTNNKIVMELASDRKTFLPKTHTVVLYAQADNKDDAEQASSDNVKILVIDPSNATFSYPLAGAHKDIRICFSNKLQIYKAGENDLEEVSNIGKIGPSPEQWRDCIDISTKLAFYIQLNATMGLSFIKVEELEEGYGYIDFNSLRDSPAVRDVTNQQGIYPKLPLEVTTHSFRIKQSSNFKESKKATALVTTINSALDSIEKTLTAAGFNHTLKIFEALQEEFLTETALPNLAPQGYAEFLSSILKDFQNEFAGDLNALYGLIEPQMQLLGLEFQNIDNIE